MFASNKVRPQDALMGNAAQLQQDANKAGTAMMANAAQLQNDPAKAGAAMMGNAAQFQQDAMKTGNAMMANSAKLQQDTMNAGTAMIGDAAKLQQQAMNAGTAMMANSAQYQQQAMNAGAAVIADPRFQQEAMKAGASMMGKQSNGASAITRGPVEVEQSGAVVGRRAVYPNEPGLTATVEEYTENPQEFLARALADGETVVEQFDVYFPGRMIPRWKLVLLVVSTFGLYLIGATSFFNFIFIL